MKFPMPMLLAGKNGKGLLEMVIDVDCSNKQKFVVEDVKNTQKSRKNSFSGL